MEGCFRINTPFFKKGKKHPVLPAIIPNKTHQIDLAGPCYPSGPIQFYSMHAVDAAINQCGLEPITTKTTQSVLDAVHEVWLRMGHPENIQADNVPVFFGSPTHLRCMGALIRLCLRYGVMLCFIPPPEPWWNGTVEKFNNHYKQKFLAQVTLASLPQLKQ